MADIPSDLNTWSSTASSNLPTDATTIGSGLADNLQALQAVVRGYLAAKGTDIASSAAPDVAAVQGFYHDVTGNNTITGLGSSGTAGIWKVLQFDGSPLLKHSTALQMVTATDVTATPGAVAAFLCEASNQWRNLYFSQATAGALVPIATTALHGIVKLAAQSDLNSGTSGLVPTSDLKRINLASTVATTSGTDHTFTGAPSDARRISVLFSGVSTNGTSDLLIQIGDSSAVATTGYSGSAVLTNGAGTGSSLQHTAGFGIRSSSATNLWAGAITLHLENSSTNTWVASGVLGNRPGGNVSLTGGFISLDSALTRVVLTTFSGDTFDAGEVGITYER